MEEVIKAVKAMKVGDATVLKGKNYGEGRKGNGRCI